VRGCESRNAKKESVKNIGLPAEADVIFAFSISSIILNHFLPAFWIGDH
jgi:hypothetical protein